MNGFWDKLLGPEMPPHGHCYLWNDDLVYLHVGSDALIAIAYLTIPLALFYLVKKREDLSFNYIFVCFALFILACGATHAMAIYNVWHGAYWLSGGIKVVTAVASVGTALLVWPLLPKALAIPSNSALREVNARLVQESEETQRQQREVVRLSHELRELVEKRTAELEETKKLKALLETKMLELEASTQGLEQFAQAASRDLREPVRNIATIGGLLTDSTAERLNQKEREWLAHIMMSSQRLAHLMNNVNRYTFYAGAEAMEEAALDTVLDEVLEELAGDIAEYGVEIDRQPLPSIVGSRKQLHSMMLHLLGSAIRFSRHSNPPEIEIGPLPDSRAGEQGFFVRDNGIGIPVEYRDTVFGGFERVSKDGEGEQLQPGLGGISAAGSDYYGRAEVNCEMGEGMDFRLYFRPAAIT